MVLKHLAKEGTCKLSSLWSLCCHNYFFAQQFCDRKRREKNCQRWQRGRSLRNVDGGLRREPLRWAVGPRRVVVLRPPISTEVMGGGGLSLGMSVINHICYHQIRVSMTRYFIPLQALNVKYLVK